MGFEVSLHKMTFLSDVVVPNFLKAKNNFSHVKNQERYGMQKIFRVRCRKNIGYCSFHLINITIIVLVIIAQVTSCKLRC